MMKEGFFRERLSLEAGDVNPLHDCHAVASPAVEEEGGLRRYAGRFVAVVRTAAGNAAGDCTAYLSGFGTFAAAMRAVAEVMSGLLRKWGVSLTAGEVEALGRRSSGRYLPEWGGPIRRFERLSLYHYYGRIYRPLDGMEAVADQAAFEAYMAKKAAEEAELRRKAEQARMDELSAIRASRAQAEDRAKARAEREAREAAEDRHLVSRLVWRATDRRDSGFRYKVDWAMVQSALSRVGIYWRLDNRQDACRLLCQPWLAAKMDPRTQRGREARNLVERKLRWAILREQEVEFLYRNLPSLVERWAKVYVARRRARLRLEAAGD